VGFALDPPLQTMGNPYIMVGSFRVKAFFLGTGWRCSKGEGTFLAWPDLVPTSSRLNVYVYFNSLHMCFIRGFFLRSIGKDPPH
jgi:hypothetical protein